MLNLVKSNDPCLQEFCEEWNFENPQMDSHKLEEEMITLMVNSNGIGLSAPQVGIKLRMFVMISQNIEELYTPFAVFNPKIIADSGNSILGDEGCLSYPGLGLKVSRPEHIVAEFFDRDGNRHIIRFDGIDARCFQHELDHLNGVCFVNRVSKLKLDRALKKQRKLNGRTK